MTDGLYCLKFTTGLGRDGESRHAKGHRRSVARHIYPKQKEIHSRFFSHLRELEGHLRGHLFGGNIVLLLIQEVLHALLVYLNFHLL